jgi:hypothetical protein
MIPGDPSGVVPVPRPAAPAPLETVTDPRLQAFQRNLAAQLGKTMQGQVLSRLADGSFVVSVAGIPARMQLPPGFPAGAEVALTLVAVTPRPTFQIGPDAGRTFATATPASQALLAYLEGGAPATTLSRAERVLVQAQQAKSAPPAQAAGGALLSSAGKAIGEVLAAAAKAGTPVVAASASAPLLAAPTADPARIATALQQGVDKSGLFYESHVAEWAQGQRTLSELAAEPQMALGFSAQPGDPTTAQFVNLQLATAEQARIAWQGPLWPGQDLQWDVQRDDGRGQGDGEPRAERWHSRLRLRFAALGELAAQLELSGGQLHLRLQTGSGAAGALLHAHAASLASALDAAGTPLASFVVQETEPT